MSCQLLRFHTLQNVQPFPSPRQESDERHADTCKSIPYVERYRTVEELAEPERPERIHVRARFAQAIGAAFRE